MIATRSRHGERDRSPCWAMHATRCCRSWPRGQLKQSKMPLCSPGAWPKPTKPPQLYADTRNSADAEQHGSRWPRGTTKPCSTCPTVRNRARATRVSRPSRGREQHIATRGCSTMTPTRLPGRTTPRKRDSRHPEPQSAKSLWLRSTRAVRSSPLDCPPGTRSHRARHAAWG